jgi:hypothetical protein
VYNTARAAILLLSLRLDRKENGIRKIKYKEKEIFSRKGEK